MTAVCLNDFRATTTDTILQASAKTFQNDSPSGAYFLVWSDRDFHVLRDEEAAGGLTLAECPLLKANEYFQVWLEADQYLKFQTVAAETDGEIRITRL